jgi:hypothetical protein
MDNKVDPGLRSKASLSKRYIRKIEILKKFRNLAFKQMKINHNSNQDTIHRKTANDIVYNEKSHIVAVFKDYLIYDDSSEFLKR